MRPQLSQETFKPEGDGRNSSLKNKYPYIQMIDSEEDEFDPNELKLLPVLATDRNKRGDNIMQLR